MDEKTYFKGWPKPSCEYVKDLIWAARIGAQYLGKMKAKQFS